MRKTAFIVAMLASATSVLNAGVYDDAYNAFASDLFTRIEQSDPNANVVISPISAWMALGMLQQGASDTTLEGIRQAMHLSEECTETAANDSEWIQALTKPCESDPNQEDAAIPALELANSIWADDQIALREAYRQLLIEQYQAESFARDLQLQASMEEIDAWVNFNTHGAIPSLSLQPEDSQLLILINALYFKGGWEKPFCDVATKDYSFYNAKGNTVKVPMMNLNTTFNYAENNSCQIVKLYLGTDKRFSMSLMMPNPKSDYQFKVEDLMAMQESCTLHSVKLKMPRFSTEADLSLNAALQTMGMDEAFTHNADFSYMTNDAVQVGMVKQLTHIEVDEKGVTAAAATVINMGGGSNFGDDPTWYEFTLDHPFYFSIEDNVNKKMLFIGHVQNLGEEATPSSLTSVVPGTDNHSYDLFGRNIGEGKGLKIRNGRVIFE